ncbi:ABC transporter ATP-binding protein [Bacillus sp. NPDC093026]|uniref:ABC transporter ATP-binding protein n=1 Tax=Bacillus sp. NPDC093026 TaxID=3363948 RepID=UPI00380A96AC
MIQLSNVTKSYQVAQETFDVLSEINLVIAKGEYVSIMGPSGSGKSTLINIIGCLDRPTSGQYRFQGRELSIAKDQELAVIRNQSIGFVFQQFHLLPRLNARRNVELPMIYSGISQRERKERAESAFEKVGLTDRMNHMPNELSGGQKQRVAIARAIVNEPQLILADEPTGALDSKTSFSIMEQFTQLNMEVTTVVLVTHEEEIAAFTHRTIIVKDGRLVEERLKQGEAMNETL